MSKRMWVLALAALLVLPALLMLPLLPIKDALAQVSQSYDLSWFALAGGGGRSAASDYALDGTLGQPFVGLSGSTQYGMQSGFWQRFEALKYSTTTSLVSSLNPSMVGQKVVFTATVSSSVGTPTGSVQFKADGTNLGSAVALAGGKASTSTASLTAGTHVITAEYGGDANHDPSTGTLAGRWSIVRWPTCS